MKKRLSILLLSLCSVIGWAQSNSPFVIPIVNDPTGASCSAGPPQRYYVSAYYECDGTGHLAPLGPGSTELQGHSAFGASGVVDNGGAPFVFSGGFFYPGKSVALIKESNTDQNGEMGLHAYITWTPSANPDVLADPAAVAGTTIVDGPNLSTMEVYGLGGEVDNISNSSGPDFQIGVFGAADLKGAGNVNNLFGMYSEPIVSGTGTASWVNGYDSDVANNGDGANVPLMTGYSVFLSSTPKALTLNTVQTAYGVWVNGFHNVGGSTTSKAVGVKIEEQATTGVGTAYQIDSEGTAPSLFKGPMQATMFQETLHTPTSSSEACTAGQFTDDASFHYVCTAANTWKRVALSTF